MNKLKLSLRHIKVLYKAVRYALCGAAVFVSVTATMLFPSGNASVCADTYGGSIDYILCGENAVITGFEGNPEILDLPGEISGKRVTEIRENTFYKCESLKKVIIPESVEKIGHHAFYECSALVDVEIYGNISSVDEGTFYGCSSLCNISLPDGLSRIGVNSFYGCTSLKKIDIPDSVTDIGEYAFAYCQTLENVSMPQKLVELETGAFFGCTGLCNIALPDGVMHIGSYALGYAGRNEPVPLNDFVIKGGEDSLGKIYADENQMKFEITEKESSDLNNSSFLFPGILIILSGMGLIMHKFAEKILLFNIKYEYES